jgi:hypothetical protein
MYSPFFNFTLFLNFVFLFLKTVGPRVFARYIREFALFDVCSSKEKCLSATCASKANVVCRDVDIFRNKIAFLMIFYIGSFFLLTYELFFLAA